MHTLLYTMVLIAHLDFKPTLHIISFRLNPPITLSSSYFANGTHFTTPFRFAQYSYTGCIRYIIFCPLYKIPDKNSIPDFVLRHWFYLPKKSQPIKCNTSHKAHFYTDTPSRLCVPFQLPVTPLKK